MVDLWPLVGRDADLREIERALGEGGSRGVVVGGEAGVGKSRLAAEIAARAAAAGMAIEQVVATETASAIPFGAFAHLVATDRDALALHDLFVETTRQLERTNASGRRCLLIVDDAQWLDGPSAALLLHLALRGPAKLLVTVRHGEVVPDPITSLWKDGLLVRFDLAPLDRSQTGELVSVVLGDQLRPDTAERLWQLSRGNALFLRELVLAGVETIGRGSRREPVVLAPGAISERLRAIVGVRFGRLDATQRAALEIVATGEPLPLAVATRVMPEDVLEVLEERVLVEVAPGPDGDEVRVAHPIYAEVLRLEVPALRRRRILSRLAAAAAADHAVDRLRLAVWRLEAGDTDDPDGLVAGGRGALARFDPVLAERLARAALPGARGVAAGLLLGEALLQQGRAAEADETLRALRPSDPDEQARVAAARTMALFFGLGRLDETVEVLEEAEASLADAPAARALCRAHRADTLMFALRLDEAVTVAEAVVADERASVPARLQALACASLAWVVRGDGEKALATDRHWFELAAEHRREVPYVDARLRINVLSALAFTGRLLDADDYGREQVARARGEGTGALLGALLSGHGRVVLERGRVHEALSLLTEAVTVLHRSDVFGVLPLATDWRAKAAVFCGALDTAEESLAEAEAIQQRSPVAAAYAVPDTMLTRAWLLAARGQRTDALALATTVGDMAEQAVPVIALDALYTVARLGDADAVARRVAVLAQRLDGVLAPTCALDAGARAAADGAAVEDASRRFEAFGADLLAAEAAAAAAALYRHQGLRTSALAADERARALLERCGRPVSPALVGADADVALTAREREIALLTAQGLSSREVADRLHLSVRTVDTHLGRVYDKLGIRSRRQLVEAFAGSRRRRGAGASP